MSNEGTINQSNRRHWRRSKDIEKAHIFAHTASDAMHNATEYDKDSLHAFVSDLNNRQESERIRLEILEKNMEKADTPEERREVREAMERARKDQDAKSTENNEFLRESRESHHNVVKTALCLSVTVATGVLAFKNGKKIMDYGSKMLSQFPSQFLTLG